jgi:hypothetical protein
MRPESNRGVTYLIECADSTESETEQMVIYEALAEAGGLAAQDYLISVARQATMWTKKAKLLRFIGRASRS